MVMSNSRSNKATAARKRNAIDYTLLRVDQLDHILTINSSTIDCQTTGRTTGAVQRARICLVAVSHCQIRSAPSLAPDANTSEYRSEPSDATQEAAWTSP
jgi:hypothetical protein